MRGMGTRLRGLARAALAEVPGTNGATSKFFFAVAEAAATGESATGAGVNIVFTPGAPRRGDSVFGDWAELCRYLDSLPFGAFPRVTITQDFTVPLVGMPVGGWDMGRAVLQAFSPQTGVVTLHAPAGVQFDMLFGINFGLGFHVHPVTDGVLNYSSLLPGEATLFTVGFGCAFTNVSPNGSAAILSPGTNPGGDTIVFALTQSSNPVAPVSTGPWIRLRGNDGAVGASQAGGFGGQFPDGWVVGGGPGSTVLYVDGISSVTPAITPGPYAPGFTGGGGVSAINGTNPAMLNYSTAGLPVGTFPNPQPQNAKDALDSLATRGSTYVFGADGLSSLLGGTPLALRPGSGATTGGALGPASGGIIVARAQTLQSMTVRHYGSAANVNGSSVTYALYKNGVAVPGATVTLLTDPTAVGVVIGSPVAPWSVALVVGDYLQIIAISTALLVSAADITATVE
jgi:hypothetical protein